MFIHLITAAVPLLALYLIHRGAKALGDKFSPKPRPRILSNQHTVKYLPRDKAHEVYDPSGRRIAGFRHGKKAKHYASLMDAGKRAEAEEFFQSENRPAFWRSIFHRPKR